MNRSLPARYQRTKKRFIIRVWRAARPYGRPQNQGIKDQARSLVKRTVEETGTEVRQSSMSSKLALKRSSYGRRRHPGQSLSNSRVPIHLGWWTLVLDRQVQQLAQAYFIRECTSNVDSNPLGPWCLLWVSAAALSPFQCNPVLDILSNPRATLNCMWGYRFSKPTSLCRVEHCTDTAYAVDEHGRTEMLEIGTLFLDMASSMDKP